MKIYLATTSQIKSSAVTKFLTDKSIPIEELITFDCSALALPEQPRNCGMTCAILRLNFMIEKLGLGLSTSSTNNNILCIAIENSIDGDFGPGPISDVCNIVMMRKTIKQFYYNETYMNIPKEYYTLMKEFLNQPKYDKIINGRYVYGFDKTFGSMLAEKNPNVDKNNWNTLFNGKDRSQVIIECLGSCFYKIECSKNNLDQVIENGPIYPNFPKPGIDFKYFYSFVSDYENYEILKNELFSRHENNLVNLVLPLGNRGLVFGFELGVDFRACIIPVQKVGKVPGEKVLISCEEEYGNDAFCISMDLFDKFYKTQFQNNIIRILIVDDLLATGNSIIATIKLIGQLSKKYGFKFVIYCSTVFKIDSLYESAKTAIATELTRYENCLVNSDFLDVIY